MAQNVNDVIKKISACIKNAKKKKKTAQKQKAKHYFKGQQDAFKQVLIELKHIEDECETSCEKNEENEEDLGEHTNETLLTNALEKGVILRKTSFYFYEEFPNGKLHGKQKVLDALQDEELFERIRKKLHDKGA